MVFGVAVCYLLVSTKYIAWITSIFTRRYGKGFIHSSLFRLHRRRHLRAYSGVHFADKSGCCLQDWTGHLSLWKYVIQGRYWRSKMIGCRIVERVVTTGICFCHGATESCSSPLTASGP